MSSAIKIKPLARPEPDQYPFLQLIPDFLTYLRCSGLTEKTVSGFSGPAKHLIIWLSENGIEPTAVTNVVVMQFFQHDCNCPRPRGSRHKNHVNQTRTYKSIIFWFVRFLEDTGKTQNPMSLYEGFRLKDDFLKHLTVTGYSTGTVGQYNYSSIHFIKWLHRLQIPLIEIDDAVVKKFINHDCICPGFRRIVAEQNKNYIMQIERFVRFLVVCGIIPGTPPLPKEELCEDLVSFRIWLRQHRGIIEKSIQRHIKTISALLPKLGSNPDNYNAALIKSVVLDCFENTTCSGAKLLTSSLRMYLRFLVTNDRCPEALIGAVPTIPRWRLSTLPRYILKDDVERVIESCDVTRPKGMRDRAIMLLLARLALRGGDVICLRLDDIDWDNAIIQVSGKTRYSVGLPLPQDVGDAILSYIEHARPHTDEEKIFLSAHPPFAPFVSSSAISAIVQIALKRAGVDNVNLRGAHLLRHSAATNMLRSGATLEAVGTLLRHQSAETTAIYAKVDIPMLEKVVQPWIGDVKC